MHRALLASLLATLAGVPGLAGCGGSEQRPSIEPGHLMMVVDITPALPIQSIDYEITARRGAPLKGKIVLDELSRTISANVRGLTPGPGYEVNLSARSPDGDLTCTGVAKFVVVSKQTTAVATPLSCRSISGSAIQGTARGYCPLIKSVAVAPVQTSVGSRVNASVTASEAGSLTYAWSAKGGSFDTPAAASTGFRCDQQGEHMLTVRVVAGACADRAILAVRCVSLACGNGMPDPGETCDDGNREDGDGCPGDCLLPGCGNGKIDPRETCEPPGSPGCDMSCRAQTGCGNGRVEAGESCDDANRLAGDGCAADCTLESAICGNGVIDPGEACEPPGTTTCSADCRMLPLH